MVEKKNSVFGEIGTDRVLNTLEQQRILVYTYYGVTEYLNNMYIGKLVRIVWMFKKSVKAR
jgi:hypothetical protein